MKPQPSPPSEADKHRDALLKRFRAHLHLAITRRQLGKDEELKAGPDPDMLAYCRALADLPDNTLAGELACPVVAVLDQISGVSLFCEGVLIRKEETYVAMHAGAKGLLEQIDFALALVLRMHLPFIRERAKQTECQDLLCEVLSGMALDDGAAHLVRRWQQKFPEDGTEKSGWMADGGFPQIFAWDVYRRVQALDELADEFPDHMTNLSTGRRFATLQGPGEQPTFHAIDQCFQQEIGKSQVGLCALLFPLQLLPDSPDFACDASDGSGDC